MCAIGATDSLAAGAHAPPDTVERLRQVVASQQPEAMRLLKELVEIPSDTLDIQGVRAVGERLRLEWDRLGFKTYWSDLPKDLQRAGALFAVHHTGRHPRILLLGHLDVAPSSQHASRQALQPRLRRVGDKITGPGVLDGKGGDVVMWHVVKAMKTMGWLSGVDMTVVLTGDEKKTGQPTTVSRSSLRAIAESQDMVFEFEWATHPDTATIARRGIDHWRLDVQSPTGHSSRIFQREQGPGAVFEAARILDAVRKRLSHHAAITVNPNWVGMGQDVDVDPGLLHGSVAARPNAIASNAVALGDFRYLTWEQKEKIEQVFADAASASLPHTQSHVTFEGGSPPMPPLAENRTLLKLLSRASEDLGYGSVRALDPTVRGASDLNYVADIVPAQLGGLGPLGEGAHTPNEYACVGSFPRAVERMALLLRRLTAEEE